MNFAALLHEQHRLALGHFQLDRCAARNGHVHRVDPGQCPCAAAPRPRRCRRRPAARRPDAGGPRTCRGVSTPVPDDRTRSRRAATGAVEQPRAAAGSTVSTTTSAQDDGRTGRRGRPPDGAAAAGGLAAAVHRARRSSVRPRLPAVVGPARCAPASRLAARGDRLVHHADEQVVGVPAAELGWPRGTSRTAGAGRRAPGRTLLRTHSGVSSASSTSSPPPALTTGWALSRCSPLPMGSGT